MKKTYSTLAVAALAIALMILVGCSTTGGGSSFNVCSAVTTVAVQQAAITTAALTFIALTKNGTLDPSYNSRAALAYGTWADSQQVITTSLVAINDSGGATTPEMIQTYTQLAIQTAILAADFIAIYEIAKAKPPALSHGKNLMAVRAGAAPCAIEDDEIRARLAVATWAGLGGVQ